MYIKLINNKQVSLTNEKSLVIIDNFGFNKPITIRNDLNHYLSAHSCYNLVDVFFRDDNSGRQKWVVEQEGGYHHIRISGGRNNDSKYLGCPNKNNIVYLYPYKNDFTKMENNKSCK